MTSIPHQYPEVVSATDEMDKLLSRLAHQQKDYSSQINNVLTEIPKNKYHGQVLELCHDQGLVEEQWHGDLFGGGWKQVIQPCATNKSDCGAPMVDFKGYPGSLEHSGDTLGTAADLNEAYNECASTKSCAGFTSSKQTGPFNLYGTSGTYYDPPGWEKNPQTGKLEPSASAGNTNSMAYVKNDMIQTQSGFAATTSKSMGVPKNMQYTKLTGVRVLSQSEWAAGTNLAGAEGEKLAEIDLSLEPIRKPLVSSSSSPFPPTELQLAFDVSNVNGRTSILVGKGEKSKTAAVLVVGAALLPAEGWTSYVPTDQMKSLAALGSLPTGTVVNSWVPGKDSALMNDRCPITCDTECGNYYFVGADNVVRPIVKKLGTCGKKATRISVDMYQFLNDQGFKLSDEKIVDENQCAINLLDWPQKQEIQNTIDQLSALGDKVSQRVVELRKQGADVAKQTGVTENEYNRVANAYQGLSHKLQSVSRVSDTLSQMVSDFDLRAEAADGRYFLWLGACIALIGVIFYILRK